MSADEVQVEVEVKVQDHDHDHDHDHDLVQALYHSRPKRRTSPVRTATFEDDREDS